MVCSLSKVKAGAENYYANLARDDYYKSHGEPPGRFLGEGANILGLSGQITRNDTQLKTLFQGKNPNDGSELRRGAYHGSAVCAWDFTFSASKSVSVLWALSDDKTRDTISDCHEGAVTKAAKYLEEHATFTRTGQGGAEKERVSPIFAAFQHSTSRDLDPQLHTHVLAINTGIRENGKGGTLDGQKLIQHRYQAQSIYSEAFENSLRSQLKVSTREVILKHGKTFEVEGVPNSIKSAFSKRREEILKISSDKDTSHERQVNVLKTRKTKLHDIDRPALFASWQAVGKEHGFNYKHVINQKTPTANRANTAPQKPTTIPDKIRSYINHHVKQYKEQKRAQAVKRSERFKQKITILYAIGSVRRSTYLRVTEGKGLPTTRLGIQFSYATYGISKKQRDYLLSKLERPDKDKNNPPATKPPQKPPAKEQNFERERQREY